MVTSAKITVDDVKKSAASAASAVKSAAAEVKKEAATAKKAATKTAAKAKATATKKATAAKKTVKKATAKKTTAKKKVATTAVVQSQGLEFSEAECLKKAQSAFKKDYKGKTLEELNIYIKPEERKIYYVANKDCVGSADL